ncbi:hypothetical protein CSA80_03035 [Candidatus Saccharibacteria bacterium]|nr:MAG: hypothetical protein CR973_00190 [Candidatus Saccharibacteria bacterium]PID99064.1 MAG: hypothetical protein CSA80_03035 [Candidatus Saccharibacteria bacterium]
MDNQPNQPQPTATPPTPQNAPVPPQAYPANQAPVPTAPKPVKNHSALKVTLVVIGTFVALFVLLVMLSAGMATNDMRQRIKVIGVAKEFFAAAEDKDSYAAYELFVDGDKTDTQLIIDAAIENAGSDCSVKSSTFTLNRKTRPDTATIKANCEDGATTDYTLRFVRQEQEKSTEWLIEKIDY